MKRVAIVVNAPVRDLPGSVLLGRELVRCGAEVFIVPSKLLEREWFAPDVVSVTGHPRFDFYVEPWRQVARIMAREQEKIRQPLVLLNTRFSLVSPDGRTAEQQKKSFIRLRWSKERVNKWQTIQREALENFVEMANRLARKLPEVTFIFCPHPFEEFNFYRGKLASLGDLHLNREGSIRGQGREDCAGNAFRAGRWGTAPRRAGAPGL